MSLEPPSPLAEAKMLDPDLQAHFHALDSQTRTKRKLRIAIVSGLSHFVFLFPLLPHTDQLMIAMF